MDVEATVRPHGLKRGRHAEKALAKALGCEADLRDMCGKLVLGATHPGEFKLLAAIWWIVSPYGDGGKITVEQPGKNPITWERKPEATTSKETVGRDPSHGSNHGE